MRRKEGERTCHGICSAFHFIEGVVQYRLLINDLFGHAIKFLLCCVQHDKKTVSTVEWKNYATAGTCLFGEYIGSTECIVVLLQLLVDPEELL